MHYPNLYYCQVCRYLRNRRRDGFGPQCDQCKGDTVIARILRGDTDRGVKRPIKWQSKRSIEVSGA